MNDKIAACHDNTLDLNLKKLIITQTSKNRRFAFDSNAI